MWDQSPQAAMRRLLVDAPAFGEARVNLASISQSSFARVGRIVGGAFLAAIFLIWILGRGKERAETLVLDLAIGCCGMLQIVGFNLKAQFVLLLIPLLVAVSRSMGSPSLARRGRVALLVLSGALLLVSNPGFVGRAVSNVALAYSCVTLGTLFLAMTLAWLRFEFGGPGSEARA